MAGSTQVHEGTPLLAQQQPPAAAAAAAAVRSRKKQGSPSATDHGVWMVLGITGLAALAIVALGFIALFDNTGDRPPNSETQLNSSSVGRFLHITDLHVDPYYRTGSTTYSSCHRKPPSSSKHARRHGSRSLNGNSDDGIADAGGKEWKRFDRDGHDHTGIFGIPEAKCDSPVALVNATAEYLRTQWADRLDFVIWTGDSGRHDNDAEIPRTFEEIIEQNHITAGAMRYAFPAIPVVPNIGNNDISPHNELARPGHKRARLTYRQLSKAWHGFIPDDQMRTFLYGGYFAKDVVDYGDSVPDDDGQLGSSPPKAAEPTHVTAAGMKKPKKAPKKQKPVRKPRGITVLSLNTIYWYRANAKVGGCAADDSPGLAQLAWIRYQMRRARQRNRDLILMGHVIPNRDNYRPTCYHGYARTVTQVIPAPALGATGGLMRKSSGSSDDDEYDLPLVHAQLYGHSNVDVWTFVGQEVEWIASASPMGGTNSSSRISADDDAVKDKRLWWEKEVDEESGYFGKLIRDVWASDETSSSSSASAAMAANQTDTALAPYIASERDWADMEDDPEVSFVENERGQLWPTTDLTMRMALPGDFVDTLFKEFERVLVLPRMPRLGISTISPSIIPKYFPAFRVFYYARTPSNGQWRRLSLGTLLDYDVYWANLNKLNKAVNIEKFFTRLYRFSSVYRLNDLSMDSYVEWARKLVGSRSLRKRFRSLTYLDT